MWFVPQGLWAFHSQRSTWLSARWGSRNAPSQPPWSLCHQTYCSWGWSLKILAHSNLMMILPICQDQVSFFWKDHWYLVRRVLWGHSRPTSSSFSSDIFILPSWRISGFFPTNSGSGLSLREQNQCRSIFSQICS